MAATYAQLANRIRKDPLSKPLMTSLLRNSTYNQSLLLGGHTPDGLHNQLEVARAVGTILNTAGTLSVSGATSFISSVAGGTAGGAVGVATITLAAGKFTTPMRVDVTCQDLDCEAKPYLATVEVVSATSVKVRTYKLTSALGAGNAWAAADCTFAISVHSAPYTSAAASLSVIDEPKLNDALDKDTWNQLVENQATQYAYATVGHSSAGVHALREVGRAWARVQWDDGGGAYDLLDSSANITSVSEPSTGRSRLNLPVSTFTTPMQVFCMDGYQSTRSGTDPGNLFIVNFPVSQMSATTVEAWIYEYDFAAKTWDRGRCDFSCVIHTA